MFGQEGLHGVIISHTNTNSHTSALFECGVETTLAVGITTCSKLNWRQALHTMTFSYSDEVMPITQQQSFDIT